MKSGITFPSIARDIAWTTANGLAAADFPVTNLANLEELRRVMLASGPGVFYAQGLFSEVSQVDFVGLIHHNAPANATVRVVLYETDYQSAYAYDSGHIPVWPNGAADAGFPNVRPILLPAPVSAGGIYVELNNMGAVVFELGAVEVGLFWSWPDVLVPREIGVKSNASSVPMGSGVSHVTRQWSPRTVTGSREAVAVADVEETLVDFQRQNGLHHTFVWCWDVEDPATWARQCMAVTNADLPAGVRDAYQSGRINFSFREQLR